MRDRIIFWAAFVLGVLFACLFISVQHFSAYTLILKEGDSAHCAEQEVSGLPGDRIEPKADEFDVRSTDWWNTESLSWNARDHVSENGPGFGITFDLTSILPIISSRAELDFLEEGNLGGDPVYAEHLAADLFVVYARETGDSFAYLRESEIAGLAYNQADLRDLALWNLSSRLPIVERERQGLNFRLVAGNRYEPSLLLFDSVWELHGEGVAGDIVAVALTSEMLLFTGLQSQEAIEEMRILASIVHPHLSRWTNDSLLIRRNGEWHAFEERP